MTKYLDIKRSSTSFIYVFKFVCGWNMPVFVCLARFLKDQIFKG